MIDVHVRFFDLDAVAVDPSLLSASERDRVARKATPLLRQRQAASFHCLRCTLGDVLGAAPASLAFHLADSGKPALVDAALHFNVSHSGGIGMLAWGSRELGADVEALIARPTGRLAQRILSTPELDRWHALPLTERSDGLTRAWTRKESALKALGSGLRTAPSALDIGIDDGPWSLGAAGRRWEGADWARGVPEGFRAAVCIEVPHGR
jgi:4'-phosphopantetheinyl transferase